MDTQELQDRYDELEKIIDTLDNLSEDITFYNDIKEELDMIRFETQQELDEVEPRLRKAYDEEERAQNREYWASQF